MDIHNIRLELRQKTIYEIPMRVTFYARVSTDSEEQLKLLMERKISLKRHVLELYIESLCCQES